MNAFRVPTKRRRVSLLSNRLVVALIAVCALFLLVQMRRFYVSHTVFTPGIGGTYIEGSVGNMAPLNPWFTVANDVNKDIVSLVFAGLQKYDPVSEQIVDDLATLVVGDEGRLYTLTLKDDIYWHDSTQENPHPVTVEDVMFTFTTIQDPSFPNQLLHQNFQGVTVEEIDDRTVRFKLDEPYRFFASNLTLGLVPKRSFEGVPVDRLDQVLDFAFAPVGAGPYQFKGLVQTELSTEITLERFNRPTLSYQYHLERLVFRIFPDYSTLLSDLRNLDGVRLVPRNEDGEPLIPNRFRAIQYTLPQYVALFLNNETAILRDQNLRLAIQLGIDKQALIDEINQKVIVDTPLLEIDVSDWRYQYRPDAAQGALFNSDWNLPEKVRLQRLLEIDEANEAGVLELAPIAYLDTGAVLTVTGSYVETINSGATLNGIQVQDNPSQSGAWIVAIPTVGSGSIRPGMNTIVLMNDDDDIVDSYYLWRTTKADEYALASNEQDLLQQFKASRAGAAEEPITVADLFLDNGFLRLRVPTDPVDIRVNNKGERLSLRLLTSATPPQYPIVADIIAKQLAELGIHVGIDVPSSREEFADKMLRRDYDILLYGQSLLDNLDSYPYWHSSGIQKVTDNRNDLLIDAYNLSQYSSLEADRLLEFIRRTGDEAEREQALSDLRTVLSNDVPAIFLYSPLYTFAIHQDFEGVTIENLSQHSDRFLTVNQWYTQEDRIFEPGVNWLTFLPWLLGFSE